MAGCFGHTHHNLSSGGGVSRTAHRGLDPGPNIGYLGLLACLMACSLSLSGVPILIGANVAYFTPLDLFFMLVLSVKICKIYGLLE